MLAGDKKDKEGEVSHNVQLSAPAQSAEVPILPTPSKETDAAAASVIFWTCAKCEQCWMGNLTKQTMLHDQTGHKQGRVASVQATGMRCSL